ncbi:uncharacterized protein [Pocillopora verrucosa]|uniref:uncharacterized protein n=1 Tax=Pocillopora verrucosa TaxID=203993 RepID=UPI00333E3E8A
MAVGRNFWLSANVCIFLCIYVFLLNYKSLHLQSNTSPNDRDVYFVSKECCRTEIAGNLRQQRSRYIARENGTPSTKLVKFLKIMQLSFFASAAIILSGDVCPQPGPLNQVVYDVPSLSIKANGLSIAHLNVRSLTGKIDQLNLVMSNNKGPDIWTFSETWLSNSIQDEEIHLPGYNCVRRDREGKQGGGVVIYCRESLNFTGQEDLMNANESVWIKINRTRCKPLIIGNVYRPPDQPVDTFLDNLNESLSRIDSTSDKVLLGDFNIDFSVQQKNANFPLKRKLRGITEAFDLKQLIMEPTRSTEYSETLIDLVFTNSHHKVVESGVFDLGLSDHSLVYCVLKSGRPRVAPKTIEYRSYKNYNKSTIANEMRERDYHLKKAKGNKMSRDWRENQGDAKGFWKTLKKTLPSSKTSTNISSLRVDGTVVTSDESIATVLNNFFVSIGRKLAEKFPDLSSPNQPEDNPNATGSGVSFQLISESFVRDAIKCLKPNKAIGLDKISARLLKDSGHTIVPSLTSLFNLLLQTGTFPSVWKNARVIPLYKKGDKQDPSNYRPISVLPTLSKILENAVHTQFYGYLTENNLISSKQFGFRLQSSSATASAQFIDQLLLGMDNGTVTGAVFSDLTKAFDTVNHSILSRKLSRFGVDDTAQNWFDSFLSNRNQVTCCGRAQSDPDTVPVGVAQGSILGPLLFIIYMNDLTFLNLVALLCTLMTPFCIFPPNSFQKSKLR